MSDRSPFELMESAWATRRDSLHLPDSERQVAMSSVRSDLEAAAEMLRGEHQAVPYAHALHLLAHVELDVGDQERADELWKAAVAVLREAGDPLQLAHKVRHLGDLEFGRGRLDEASGHYAEALGLYRSHEGSDDLDVANAVNRVARLKERLGDAAGARELWAEVKERYARIGILAGVREAEQHLEQLG